MYHCLSLWGIWCHVMLGIVLVSHGEMAQGMLQSARMFFSEVELQQVVALSLALEENPDAFDERLQQAIQMVDQDDGVIILVDLLGGTPCNRTAYLCNSSISVITGMNFPMLVELLGMRFYEEEISITSILETGKDGIVNYNELLEQTI